MNYRGPPALRGMARGVSDFGIFAALRGIGDLGFFCLRGFISTQSWWLSNIRIILDLYFVNKITKKETRLRKRKDFLKISD